MFTRIKELFTHTEPVHPQPQITPPSQRGDIHSMIAHNLVR